MAKRRFRKKQLDDTAAQFQIKLTGKQKFFVMSMEMAINLNGMEIAACSKQDQLNQYWDWLENNKETVIGEISSRGDLLMYGDHTGKTKKGVIAGIFNRMAKAIAIMAAFNPYGIEIFGLRFNFKSQLIREWIDANQIH